MSAESIGRLLVRDLRAVRRQVESYPSDSDLWKLVPGVRNSAGTLALHVAGNLSHFVGATLGDTGYVRDREAEFASRDVPRAEIVTRLEAAIAAVESTLAAWPDHRLTETYPLPVGDLEVVTGEFLTHLAVHLGYHLGQIDYHRRFVTGDAGEIGAVAVSELRSARGRAGRP